MKKYKLVFENQSVESAEIYETIRETNCYIFLKNVIPTTFIYRVHKSTLNIKGIKQGIDSYQFDVPKITMMLGV